MKKALLAKSADWKDLHEGFAAMLRIWRSCYIKAESTVRYEVFKVSTIEDQQRLGQVIAWNATFRRFHDENYAMDHLRALSDVLQQSSISDEKGEHYLDEFFKQVLSALTNFRRDFDLVIDDVKVSDSTTQKR